MRAKEQLEYDLWTIEETVRDLESQIQEQREYEAKLRKAMASSVDLDKPVCEFEDVPCREKLKKIERFYDYEGMSLYTFLNLTKAEVLRVRGVGKTTMKALNEWLEAKGLEFFI